MGILFGIIELMGFLLDIIGLILAIGDSVAWLKGRNNRLERKDAKKRGAVPPVLNIWNRAFIILFIILIIITSLILIRTFVIQKSSSNKPSQIEFK
jgi:uncharacterized membrane protein YidH (DUF202 family)